ncbi:MAG: hypothetical protein QN166_05235, partial [Armatimonadota bacterium]|nr:hypothetical protein [Armatimonadota bacterium]
MPGESVLEAAARSVGNYRITMTAAQRVTLEYGDGLVEVEVPEGAVVVEPATLYQEPAPPEDPVLLTRRALA